MKIAQRIFLSLLMMVVVSLYGVLSASAESTLGYSLDNGSFGSSDIPSGSENYSNAASISQSSPVEVMESESYSVEVTTLSIFAEDNTPVSTQSPTCGTSTVTVAPGRVVTYIVTGSSGVVKTLINWGDTHTNSPGVLSGDGTYTHTYGYDSSYYIRRTVTNSAGKDTICDPVPVTAAQAGTKNRVTVNMDKAAPYAAVKVLLNGSIKSQGSTGSPGLTWTSALLPSNANYKLSVTKPGKTFSCNGAIVDLSAGNQTINCTVTP